jgi:hypothetical protein
VRFLLWDLEQDRFYRYQLEISSDTSGRLWNVVASNAGKDDECRSWQLIRFPRQKVQVIRLIGTYNSANSGFHVVELQACIEPPDGFPAHPQGPRNEPAGKRLEVLEF